MDCYVCSKNLECNNNRLPLHVVGMPQIGKVFKLDDIVEAHATMEENRAGGKIVVLT